MTHAGRTEIEMVQRHIRVGEKHVARQREIVASLPQRVMLLRPRIAS